MKKRGRKEHKSNYTIPDWVPTMIRLDRGDGKTCAIVGNAQSILNKNNGHVIDKHETVVRINTPKIQNEQCQGKRCDVLFVTPVSVRLLRREEVKTSQIIDVNEHIPDFFNMWTDKLRKDVGDNKARPTTGFVATAKMLELGYNVNLFGFDWFETPSLSGFKFHKTLSIEKTMWKHHYPQWEKQQIERTLLRTCIR